MKITRFLLLCFLFPCGLVQAQMQPLWAKTAEGWGILTLDGEYETPARYDAYKPIFQDPVKFAVYKDGKWGLLDETGIPLLAPTYEDIRWYSLWDKVFAKVVVGGSDYGEYRHKRAGYQVGAMDSYGKIILSPDFDVIHYYEGYFSVGQGVPNVNYGGHSSGGQWGLYDVRGNRIRENAYDFCHSDGRIIRAGVGNTRYFWRISDGAEVVSQKGDYYKEVSENCFLKAKDGREGMVDFNGNNIVDFKYDKVHSKVRDGFVAVGDKGRYGIYELGGGEVLPLALGTWPLNCGNGVFLLVGEAFFDAKTGQRYPCEWRQAWDLEEGYTLARKTTSSRVYLVNQIGEIQGGDSYKSGYYRAGYWFLRIDEEQWVAFNPRSGNFTNPYPNPYNYSAPPKPYHHALLLHDKILIINDFAIYAEAPPKVCAHGIRARLDGKESFHALDGTPISTGDHDRVLPINGDRLLVRENGVWEIRDYEGDLHRQLDLRPDEILPFSEGMAVVVFKEGGADCFGGRREKYGYINGEGELAIPAIYDDARPFLRGVAAVRKVDAPPHRPWSLLGKQGQFLKEDAFEDIGWE